jgi:hypothetical protein
VPLDRHSARSLGKLLYGTGHGKKGEKAPRYAALMRAYVVVFVGLNMLPYHLGEHVGGMRRASDVVVQQWTVTWKRKLSASWQVVAQSVLLLFGRSRLEPCLDCLSVHRRVDPSGARVFRSRLASSLVAYSSQPTTRTLSQPQHPRHVYITSAQRRPVLFASPNLRLHPTTVYSF